MTKRISYRPTNPSNFHNTRAILLTVSGNTDTGYDGEPVYLITRAQADRISKHFCGIRECRCSAGAVQQMSADAETSDYGIRVAWCGDGWDYGFIAN